ncbi:hypothetical protein Dda_9038 [Drechslerella dactyloides]|uniref:Uncharacterized protein n=1 Tax=Drechslerella dactyloides TaxID=74499 RepID=A0AAD6IPT1_DREDA|nr:hypothetical protein Dda_9038 [Drechslerella dactyloides]
MSSSTTSTVTESHSPPEKSSPSPPSVKKFRLPTGYYFLVLLSPLLLGLSCVLGGLILVLTGVLLILAAPFLLIVGLFVVPRNVSSDDPRWGWKWVLDKNVGDLQEWVRVKVLKGVSYFKGKAE